MLLCSLEDLRPFHVLGVGVTPLFGPLDLDYVELDRAEFDAARDAMSDAASASDHQGVVVTAPPGHSLRAHYHGVPQFQVFHQGTGRVGRHDVSTVSVHYADALTPYGPIVAGPDGLAYAVLRPRPDAGAHWMPEDRAGVPNGPRRRFTVHLDLEGRDAPPPGSPRAVVAPLPDHPAAVMWHRFAADTSLDLGTRDADAPTRSLLALVGGTLVGPTPATAPAFGHLGEAGGDLRSGPDGADLLELVAPLAIAGQPVPVT